MPSDVGLFCFGVQHTHESDCALDIGEACNIAQQIRQGASLTSRFNMSCCAPYGPVSGRISVLKYKWFSKTCHVLMQKFKKRGSLMGREQHKVLCYG